MRSRIRLSAFATERISSGPCSGSGAVAPFRLKLSAAFANEDNGAAKARAAHSPSRVTLMTANSSVIIHGPPMKGGRGRWSGSRLADIIAPSGSTMPSFRVSPSDGAAKIR